MVRVWYEPPPFGPRTDLNRSPYGLGSGSILGRPLERLSKMPRTMAMTPIILGALALAWIPVYNPELPFSFDPEYQAATRAYMRYHNMNPIFGISSKYVVCRVVSTVCDVAGCLCNELLASSLSCFCLKERESASTHPALLRFHLFLQESPCYGSRLNNAGAAVVVASQGVVEPFKFEHYFKK